MVLENETGFSFLHLIIFYDEQHKASLWLVKKDGFFCKKYNAEQALAQFAAAARDEVDMDKLAAALIGVVEETMQPERVSLWLKDSNARPALSLAEGTQRREGAKE